jgi:hypothetical protein
METKCCNIQEYSTAACRYGPKEIRRYEDLENILKFSRKGNEKD